jgi:predicted lipoprotein with Yx(FWY)xxD motif
MYLSGEVKSTLDEMETPMITKTMTLFLLAASLFSATAASAAGMLTDSKGMTLYVFDKDKGAVSSCYSDCAKHWPPYLAKKGEKMGEGWATTKRKDGAMQWTYDKHPVYYFASDKKPGDKSGDGAGGVWHVVVE